MTTNFEGHKLVVVGGSSGIGYDTAADVVTGGGSAVIVGRDQARVDDAVAKLSEDGPAYGITADLADRMQVARVQQQLADEHADATLLVNAAGFFIPKPFLEHDGASYDSYLELDRAIFFITQTVVRGMIGAGRGGAIVNIDSVVGGHQAVAAFPASAYSVAKAGLQALTRSLAMELGPYKIRVNAVAPGLTATPFYESFIPRNKLQETLRGLEGFPAARPGGHGARHRLCHQLPAFPGIQLGDRGDLERGRRPHGGTDLARQRPGRGRDHPSARCDRKIKPGSCQPRRLSVRQPKGGADAASSHPVTG